MRSEKHSSKNTPTQTTWTMTPLRHIPYPKNCLPWQAHHSKQEGTAAAMPKRSTSSASLPSPLTPVPTHRARHSPSKPFASHFWARMVVSHCASGTSGEPDTESKFSFSSLGTARNWCPRHFSAEPRGMNPFTS